MNKTEKMETSSDSSSSSDSEENELEARAEELEKQLADNKYIYNAHLELVELYKKLGDLKSMRAAYERFHSIFPLTPQIWLTWIRIEMELANTFNEKKKLLQLFEKAVEDYLSIDLWLEYAQFSMGILETNEIRTIIEKGLTVGGLHVSQGSLLWDVLREFEATHLSLTEPKSEEWQKQLHKLYDVFRRQLSVPLLDMENTYNEWKSWLEQLPEGHGIDPKSVEWGYHNALKKLEKYKPFEDRLLQATDDKEILTIFKEYIKACDDPSTCLCLFERAVEKLSLDSDLWIEYCYYAMKLSDLSINVVKRALRNCPWSEELWICQMRILENQNRDEREITEAFELGLSAISPAPGLNLWLSYLEYFNRKGESKEHLHKLFSQAAEQIGEENDPSFILKRWEARLYARENKIEASRKIWTDILRNPSYRRSASAWLEYASLERQFGDTHQLRVTFERALSVPLDWPQCVAEEWHMFERECGSLQDIIRCSRICKESLNKHSVSNGIHPQSQNENVERRKRPRDGVVSEVKAKKSKLSEETPKLKKNRLNPSDFDSDKSVFLSNMRSDVDEEKIKELFPNAVKIHIPTDKRGHSRCFAYVEFPEKEEAEKALARDREPLDGRPLFISECRTHDNKPEKQFKYSLNSEKNKLFVRGLPFSHTQEDIEQIFKPHGALAVRLVTYKNGKSKGIAYVEFQDEETAQKALKATDQMSVGDCTISVAVSAPPPKRAPSEEQTFSSIGAGFRNARTRLQVPLVPRAVQNKTAVATLGENTKANKSNEDFRKMLLEKKSE